MKKLVFLFVCSLISVSCTFENRTPYYKFSKKDYKFIPTIYEDVGKIFTYRNQMNEEVKLEVLDYILTKESAGGV